MKFTINIDDKYIIPLERFDNDFYIDSRCIGIDFELSGKLKSVLKYLYVIDSEKAIYSLDNKNKNKVIKSGKLLEAELVILKYLFTRGSGSEKYKYGKPGLKVARDAKYRCEHCSSPDVRSLILDHVWDDANLISELLGFQLLCQNCHSIKSRMHDWNGKKFSRDKIAGVKKLLKKFK